MSSDPSNEVPGGLKNWLGNARSKGGTLFKKSFLRRWGASLRKKLPKDFQGLELKDIQLKNLSEYAPWIRRGLLVLGVFLASEVASRAIGLFIRPTFPPVPKKMMASAHRAAPTENYDAITDRNMFNVEHFIPPPIDQGQLDCFSEARPTTTHVQLLGTIVMNDDVHSVALLQDENNPVKIAVSKNEVFFDKYQMMKIERKKICFQIRATQDLEFIEIPDDSPNMASNTPNLQSSSDGIQPVSENQFVVKQSFLEKNLLNLNEILQTARAVPYIEPGTGKFKGFLIQSIDPNSPFAQLGIKQGDILTGVNDIVLDNAGKGLEAFQRLRNSPKVELKVIRGGEEHTMDYDVK
jgi:general secretion pathway protein C